MLKKLVIGIIVTAAFVGRYENPAHGAENYIGEGHGMLAAAIKDCPGFVEMLTKDEIAAVTAMILAGSQQYPQEFADGALAFRFAMSINDRVCRMFVASFFNGLHGNATTETSK